MPRFPIHGNRGILGVHHEATARLLAQQQVRVFAHQGCCNQALGGQGSAAGGLPLPALQAASPRSRCGQGCSS